MLIEQYPVIDPGLTEKIIGTAPGVTIVSKDEDPNRYGDLFDKLNIGDSRDVTLEYTTVLFRDGSGQCPSILDNAVALKPITTPDNPYLMHPDRIITTLDKNGVERYDFGKVKDISASEIIEIMEKGIDLSISNEVAQFIARGEFLDNKDTLILKDPKSGAIVVFSERAVLDIYEDFSSSEKTKYTLAELRQLFIDGSSIDKVKDKSKDSVCFVDCGYDSIKNEYNDKSIYVLKRGDKDFRIYDVENDKMRTIKKGEAGVLLSEFVWHSDRRFTTPIPHAQER